MFKFSYEQVAIFLVFLIISLVMYFGKMVHNHSNNIGFQFKFTDFLFTTYGFVFSQILFVVGQKFTTSISKYIQEKTFPGQSFQEKLLQIGSSLGESVYQLINVIFMMSFLGGTEYCPSVLGGTLDLTQHSIDKHDVNISIAVQAVYMACFGFSLTKLYVHFAEQSPQNYSTYFTFLFHHVLTSALILSSYMIGCTRWGLAIWFLHEINEFLLKSNRTIRQINSLVEFSKYYFLLFAFFWVYLRVYGFFVVILKPLFVHSFHHQFKDEKLLWLTRAFLFGLIGLFSLNVKWAIEICAASYRKLKYNKDERVIEDSKKIKAKKIN